MAFITEVYTKEVDDDFFPKLKWFVRDNGESKLLCDYYPIEFLDAAILFCVEKFYPEITDPEHIDQQHKLIEARTLRSRAVRDVAILQQQLAEARQELKRHDTDIQRLDNLNYD